MAAVDTSRLERLVQGIDAGRVRLGVFVLLSYTLYDDTSDFGGHPNQSGVAASLLLDTSSADVPKVKVGILDPGSRITLAALKTAIDVTIGAAKTVGLIYPERFQIMGANDEINQLVQHSATCSGSMPGSLKTPGTPP